MVCRLRVVGVMGSGTAAHEHRSCPVGELCARLGVHLLTGGGRGVMQAVAEAFVSVTPRKGLSIGILPGTRRGDRCEAPDGYPNPFVELPIRTHLPDRGEQGGSERSRNTINIASADAVVVLPGGAGTASEARLAREMGIPAIGFGRGQQIGLREAGTIREVEIFLREALSLDELHR